MGDAHDDMTDFDVEELQAKRSAPMKNASKPGTK